MTTTAEVPGRWDVAVNGTGFMLDEQGDQPALEFQSLPQQREQQGGANANIGEATVNPEGFWRRSRDGWHDGAGQTYGDRDESDPLRFRTSQGVDVFGTKHQLSLLHDVDLAFTSVSGDPFLMVAGSRVYVLEAATLKYTTAPLTVPWTTTTVTGLTSGTAWVNGMATDGTTIYVARGANGIYTTTTTTSTASSFITGTVVSVHYVKGRLLAFNGANVYNPTAAGALPSALLTLPTGFTWSSATGGPNFIYMLASNGSNTVIYKTAIKADGTALDVPTVAGELPAGQVGVNVFSYLDRVFVNSTSGVRMAAIDADGNLVFGSEIPVASTTFAAATARDRFVWFSWPDATGNGLGRMDLSVATLPNTPAYAHDVRDTAHAGAAADINSIVSVSGKRIFASGTSVFVESDDYVTEGHVDSGLLALDLADAKTPVSMDVEAGGLDADHTVVEALSTDRGASFTTVGTWDDQADGDTPITGVDAARQFEVRTTLTSDGTDTPVLYRWTLKTEPHIALGDYVILRLRLFEDVIDNTGSRTGRTPNDDIALLQGWQDSREVVDLQVGSLTYTATLRDLQLDAQTRCASADDGSWNTVGVARFKIVAAA